FHSRDGALALPLGRLPAPPGTPVVLGLRPRDIVLGEAPGQLPLRGRVYVVEPLGRQLEVTLDVGENRIALVTPRERVEPDSPITVSVPPSRLLLFAAEGGTRIELAPSADGNGRALAATEEVAARV
ncbi:MAG: TOBE domain-containing protein, partial [Chloroflexota bacterium]|nr:TOBE domain-containing protein [Chloroflexota bacterium]